MKECHCCSPPPSSSSHSLSTVKVYPFFFLYQPHRICVYSPPGPTLIDRYTAVHTRDDGQSQSHISPNKWSFFSPTTGCILPLDLEGPTLQEQESARGFLCQPKNETCQQTLPAKNKIYTYFYLAYIYTYIYRWVGWVEEGEKKTTWRSSFSALIIQSTSRFSSF